MIIIARKVGQLGNRLSLFAHVIACAHEHNVRLINPAFGDYAEYFRTTRCDALCRYPPTQSRRRPHAWLRAACHALTYYPTRLLAAAHCTDVPCKVVRLRIDQACDLGDPQFVKWIRGRKLVVLQGWKFRNSAALRRHAAVVRSYFRPIQVHEEAADRIAAEARQGSDLLIGVHMRQGDYARFLGGRYFYSLDQYQRIMWRAEQLFAPRKVSFLVCSNDSPRRDTWGDTRLTFGTGQLVEDLYALAHCDYLIGPPSTFTMWASFYGEVPLCSVVSPDMTIQLNDFQPAML